MPEDEAVQTGPFAINKGHGGSRDIRRFYEPRIQEQIDAALDSIPKDRKGIVILHGTGTEARLTTAANFGDADGPQWSIVTSVKGDLRKLKALQVDWAVRLEW